MIAAAAQSWGDVVARQANDILGGIQDAAKQIAGAATNVASQANDVAAQAQAEAQQIPPAVVTTTQPVKPKPMPWGALLVTGLVLALLVAANR